MHVPPILASSHRSTSCESIFITFADTRSRFILGTDITWEDLDAAKNNKLPPSITSKDVGTALEALHNNGGVILGVLHSFG
jgi:hypothetical protein